MKEIIIGLICAILIYVLTFIYTCVILSLIFWCFGISFSLRLAFGIWIIIAALIAFVKWLFYLGNNVL